MSDPVKTLLALWLCLVGLASGKAVYTAAPPLEKFSVKFSKTLEISPPETQASIREIDLLNYDCASGHTYGPFGETIYARGQKADSCPFRFATKYYDQETGLYNFGRRFLDPITGQFLSRDPLGEKESLNLYQITGGDPINYVDVDGLAKVALDGKSNLTAIGQIILDIAKGDPNAARSLLMAKQVDAETAGIAVTGDGGEDSVRNVTRAIETAVGNAQEDGRDEWRMIAAKAGLSGERYFGGYKDAWMTAKLAEYAPMIAANAGAAIQLRNAERAVNDKATADQNSAPYKLREFLDAPFDVAAFLISAGAATDVTTGNAVTWNSWNNGGGFGLAEVTPGERAFATAMVFLPVGRVGGVADDFVRVGARGRSFAGTALKPWGARGANFFENTARNATRNPGSRKLVLGHFARDGASYQKVAAHYNATYFKVDDWNAVTKGLTQDEIWNINESFLTQQLKQGKHILFSHDPLSARPRSFFEREVNFLQDLGFGFRQKNPWTWEAFK